MTDMVDHQHSIAMASLLADAERIRKTVTQGAELLPAQGPITSFVFLNPLQALEDLPFDQAVERGGKLWNCEPYLPESRYREKLAVNRIRRQDLMAVLKDDLATRSEKRVGPSGTRFDLQLDMLEHAVRVGPAPELQWFVAETSARRSFRREASITSRNEILAETRRWAMQELCGRVSAPDARAQHKDLERLLDEVTPESVERWTDKDWDSFAVRALWEVCQVRAAEVELPHAAARPPIRMRDRLLRAGTADSDILVHAELITYLAAFVDQGFASWSLPGREKGLLPAFASLHGVSTPGDPQWLALAKQDVCNAVAARSSPLNVIADSLRQLQIPDAEWDDYLIATLLALKGWAGLIWQLETRPDRVAYPVPGGSLFEYLALRLILERRAQEQMIADAGIDPVQISNENFPDRRALPRTDESIVQRAFMVSQMAQLRGWSAPDLLALSTADWTDLVYEIEAFDDLQRRRLFQQAFERRFRIRALDALTNHRFPGPPSKTRPPFQAVFCIDTREESFRRHLEEIAPQVATYGAAGFFGIPIYYRGASDANFSTLCPIVIRPKHWLTEEVVYTLQHEHQRRQRTRQALGAASRNIEVGSRSMAAGAALTAGLGVLATIPMVAQVLFPRWTARFQQQLSHFVEAPQQTRLRIERTEREPGPTEHQIGFTLEEMVFFGEKLLREIGLTRNFARLVLFLGHGSHCLNNPHKSAYDCGACSGGAGGPNARALAAMLNDARVRSKLFGRGIEIPNDTVFVGGLHNTGSDIVSMYDLDTVPPTHGGDLAFADQTLMKACRANAHERCRRFQSAPVTLSLEAAHRHVEARTQDLAQTRPEFGNCTNAMCVVGRRDRTKGLYLDRRSFLVSYDPLSDTAGSEILARILNAVVPVCEGINLLYHFSYLDNRGWGSGTKLPHNVTSLLGVMDGAVSDLRTGLPWQGVEIHEPMRLLFVLETTPEAIQAIMAQNPNVRRILQNGWSQLALLDPHSSQILHYHQGQFVPYAHELKVLPHANSSIEWYRGSREHLDFARIGPPETGSTASSSAKDSSSPSRATEVLS